MKVKVNVLRPLWFRGESYAAGVQLDVEPFSAWELVASGRAELVDPQRAAEAVRKAVQADVSKTLRNESLRTNAPTPRVRDSLRPVRAWA